MATLRTALKKAPRLRRLVKGLIRVLRQEPKITYGCMSDEDMVTLIGKDDPIILDIGCNDGSQTLWFLTLFKEARVFSFEPDPRARERYAANVQDDRALLFDLAISDTDGLKEFFVSSGFPPDEAKLTPENIADWDLSGSLRRPKKHLERFPWCAFDKSMIVKTKRLDSWVQEQGIGVIDFLWADIQGAEVDLVAGGKEALKKTRYFYTEYSNTELYEGQVNLNALLKLLPNFHVVRRYENDVLLKNRSVV